jgi:chlorobactene glucosyltransferase
MIPNEPLQLAATVAGLWFLIITTANIFFLRRTRHVRPVRNGPRVSVVLPARNEADNIGPCLESLLTQTYTNYEVIVVDDNSEDETHDIVARYAHNDPRVILVDGKMLPHGWNGKQFACHQGVQRATGELLLMTDADVRHAPESIARAVGQLQHAGADFLSGYVRQDLRTFGELLIVPMTYIMTSLMLPLRLLASRLFPSFGFAIGQYVLVRREALEKVGGYESVKDSLVEDMSLSQVVRAAGIKTIFVDAQDSAECRMYHGYIRAFRGLAKCVFGAVSGSAVAIFALAVAITLLIVLPVREAYLDIAANGVGLYPSAGPVILFLVLWTLTVFDRGLPPWVAFFYPLAFANLVVIGLFSMLRTGFGRGVEWKGRPVRIGREDLPDPHILNAIVLYRFLSFVVFNLTLIFIALYDTLFFGLRVRGRKHLQSIDGGFFLISNHSLYLDPGIIAHAIFPRRTYFSALAETFERPFIGEFIRLLGAFPLPTESCIKRILPAIEWALRRGRCVHFFPEGELSRYSQEPADFHEGVFFLAQRFDAPVVPITLVVTNRQLFGHKLKPPFIRVTVDIGPPLYPSEFASGQGRSEAIRSMAKTAREQMAERIEAVR